MRQEFSAVLIVLPVVVEPECIDVEEGNYLPGRSSEVVAFRDVIINCGAERCKKNQTPKQKQVNSHI